MSRIEVVGGDHPTLRVEASVDAAMTLARRLLMTLLVLGWVFNAGAAHAAANAPPVLFFSDLESGPNTGGQDGKGVFVTLWGNGLGTTQGTSSVSIGGGIVDHCPVWGAPWLWYQKITCQIGSQAATGPIVVTVNGVASNPLPFTVRPGNIYFVTPTGDDDTGDGSFSNPWQSLLQCKNSLGAGDTCYIRQGVTASVVDDYDACVAINSTGAAGQPKALVAYPGETPSLGSNACQYAMRTPSIAGAPFAYWVISQLTMIGDGNQALDLTDTNDWRVIGNDLSCPNSPAGQAACWETSATASFIYAYGNHLHDFPSGDKQFHGFYFSDNVNDVWVGWNSIHDGGCRGVQFHSTGAPNLFDLHVHDNLIHDIRCDGINMATIDPSKGPVEVYNNVIYRTGKGPDYTTQGPASYTCITSPGITNAGSPGTGTAYFYQNTLADCSSRSPGGGGTTQGAVAVIGAPSVQLNNNLIVSVTGDTGGYLSSDSTTLIVSGSNNLCFGVGPCPGSFGAANLGDDPLFVDAGNDDFHLKSGSAAIDAGTARQTSSYDNDGLIRPNPPSIGAYEFASAPPLAAPDAGQLDGGSGRSPVVTGGCSCGPAASNLFFLLVFGAVLRRSASRGQTR